MLSSRNSCVWVCQGVAVEAVWPHHLAEPGAVELCGSQGVQRVKQRDRNGDLVQGEDTKFSSSERAAGQKGVTPSL